VRSRSRRESVERAPRRRVYTLCCSTQREMLRTPKHESHYTAHNVQHNAPNQENAAHIMVGCVIDGPTSRHQAPKKRFARQMVTLTTGSTQRVGCSLATRVIARVSNKRSPPSPGAVPGTGTGSTQPMHHHVHITSVFSPQGARPDLSTTHHPWRFYDPKTALCGSAQSNQN
jgi:hypothetical protein